MSEHTPGPWISHGQWDDSGQGIAIESPRGWTLAHTHYLGGTQTPFLNARRIVSCVNACEGINPAAVPDLMDALKIMINKYINEQVAWGRNLSSIKKDQEVVDAKAALAKARQL